MNRQGLTRCAVCVAMAAVLAQRAQATAFNDAADGNWSTGADPGHAAANVWGAGIGGVAGTNYPFLAGDTATIDSNRVIFDINIPADVSITLAGGELEGHRADLGLRTISAPINVTAPSLLDGRVAIGFTPGAYNTLAGNISGSGKLTLENNARRIELTTTDNSGFSGGWNLNNSEIAFSWPSGSVGTGNQVLGTGGVESDGGILRFHQNVGTLPNSFTVNSGGLTVEANSGGGLGTGSVAFGGVLSGTGTLTLQAESSGANKTSLTNAGNTVSAVTKVSNGLAEFTTPGALPSDLLTVTAGTVELNTIAGVWDVADMALILTGGVIDYDAVLTELIVEALTVNGTSFGPGSYDITQTHSGVDFSTFFNGTGDVTVAAAEVDAIPEPSTWFLFVVGSVLVAKRRRPDRVRGVRTKK